MRYFGSVYRPPSEAYSLIVQVTYGCSHNTCAFCSMYKEKHFAVRPLEEVLEDFRIARRTYARVGRVFLADGDALVRKANELYTILDTIRELFPECERVTCYASPTSIRIRTDEELRTLRAKGLTMVYMGLESGCDEVLTLMRKGHTAADIVAMGQKVRKNGIALSVTAITRRNSAVAALVDGTIPREELITALTGMGDMERLLGRIVYGTAGMLDGIIDRIREQFGGKEISVVATGGNAPVIVKYCRNKIVYDKYLLMDGLWAIYQKNK